MRKFYILRKNFNGRIADRYFQSWEKAKEEMNEDINSCVEHLDGKVREARDHFNADKGIHIYQKTAYFDEVNEWCTWAILDGYFED